MSFANTKFNQHALAAAMTVALGASPLALADTYTFTWNGYFRMLDPQGAALANTSITGKGVNQFETPITGTLTYDTATGTGTGTMASFGFFNNPIPAEALGVTVEAIGDGSGGPGNLLLANMIFNWGGNNGIPVSLVLDATGFFNSLSPTVTTIDNTATGTLRGAADGTYVGGTGTHITSGYLDLGVVPIATTTWNTTPTCTPGGGNAGACMGVNPSGSLPLVADTAVNANDWNALFMGGDGSNALGIGSNPMLAGPFEGYSANFDIVDLALTSFTDTTAPVITLGGAGASVTLNQGDPWNDPVTCNDAVDGALTSGAGLTIGGDTVDPNTPNTYNVTYTCTDSSTNSSNSSRTVTVVAVGTPVITLSGANPLTFEAAASYTDPGASCTDPEDGTLTPTISSNTVQSNVPGSYGVTYSCSDSVPNTSTASRTVNVVDTTAPSLSLSATCPIVVLGGPGVTDPTPTATSTDIVDGDLSSSVAVSGGPVNPNPTFTASQLSQTFNLGYTVTDSNSNTTTQACQVVIGNPTPVVTLSGAATVTLNEGDGYTDPGATCQDFNASSPSTPDTLTATPDISIDTTTPAGNYSITYSCTDASMNTGTTTRTIIVQGAGSYVAAPTTSGSNFSMLDPAGAYVGGASDIFSSWDGSLLTSAGQATINMTMGSALPTPFFGFPWDAHDIRVFGPGSYSLTTSRGNPLNFTVGSNQIGAHMLFDWNGNNNIDVAIVWNINGSFTGNGPVNNQVFNMASVDGDGDGFPGIRMPDGPFTGFSANFNINFTPAYTLPAVQAPLLTASQGGTTRTVLTGGGNVTVSSSTGSSFDWSGSSAALVSAAVGNTSSSTFTFDPSGLTAGTHTIALSIDGGTATGTLVINVVSSTGGVDVADGDNDGIPNYLDTDPTGTTPTSMQISSTGNSIVSDSGKLELGSTAFAAGADGAGVAMADISAAGGVADTGSSQTCIGGCFDFTVTGVTPGSTVQIVLPLSTTIPANAVYRKLIGGTWRDFGTTGGNAIASAASVAGVCPAVASASYTSGLAEGHDCVRLTIVDGGTNDADGLPNGVVRDPGGLSVAAATSTPVSSIGDPSTGGGGGCTVTSSQNATQRLDLWLLGALMALFGLRRHKLQ